MTVVCPSCDARFRDPPVEISVEHPVQCGKCEHEWVRSEQSIAVEHLAEATMDDVLNDKSEAIQTNQKISMSDNHDSDDILDPLTHTALSTDVIEPLYVDRESVEPEKRRSGMYLASVGLLGLSVMTGAVAMRDTVVEYVPETKPAYQFAGFAFDKSGLEIANVKTVTAEKDGIRQLIVRGDIQNTAQGSVRVPPIKLTMRGEQKTGLYQWTVSTAKGTLESGESSRFTAIAHDYPGDAVDVEVEFASLPTEKKSEAN